MASNTEPGIGRENEEDTAVSMVDVLQEEQQLEEDANAVLGDSDDKDCTYPKGYIPRQALYACATCVPSSKLAGVCLACSLECHDGHHLYELYTKRHFRCDCGNSKFGDFKCKILPEKDATNPENNYNQNFEGLYCCCSRPYPDPEDDVEDDMIQCVVCEDWLHGRHLGSSVPANDQYEEMICTSCMDRCGFLWSYSSLCSGKPKPAAEVEKFENVKKCQACLSTLLRLNQVSTPEDKRHQLVDLVQELVDGKVDAVQFEKKARKLLKEQAQPFLVPFLDKSLKLLRWSLHADQVKIAGITAPAETVPMSAPSAQEGAAGGSGEKPAYNLEELEYINTCQGFLATILDLASQLGTETEGSLKQVIQQLVDDKMTNEEFHQRLNGLLSLENTAYVAPIIESALPRLRWSMLHGGEQQLSGIRAPPESAPVEEPIEEKEAESKEVTVPAGQSEADACQLKSAKAKDPARWAGATFWPENWRSKLCQCTECKQLYQNLGVVFLLDQSDTIHAYEERGKQRVAPLNQYEKGMRVLSGMDRVQQVEVLHEYNDLKSELSDYLKSFAESGKVVREEDIKEFFSDLQARKKQKTSGGMQYFCK